MKFAFDKIVRDAAESRGTYLVGVVVRSPHPDRGQSAAYASPALNEADAMKFFQIATAVFNGLVHVDQLLAVVEGNGKKPANSGKRGRDG